MIQFEYFTDFNECLSNPCQNSANCSEYFGYYNCSCLHGFNGTNCENS